MNIIEDSPLGKEEQKELRQTYEMFERVFDKFYFKDFHLSIADVFFKYIELFSYPVIKARSESQMKADFKKLRNELLLSARGS